MRACSGEKLSPEERKALDARHAEMDAEEEALIISGLSESPSNEELRSHIRYELDQLQKALNEIRRIEERNDTLHRPNEELKRLLVARGAGG